MATSETSSNEAQIGTKTERRLPNTPSSKNMSERITRLFKPRGIKVAHRATKNLREDYTENEKKTNSKRKSSQRHLPGWLENCGKDYTGQMRKKLVTWIHEQQLKIKRHETLSFIPVHEDR